MGAVVEKDLLSDARRAVLLARNTLQEACRRRFLDLEAEATIENALQSALTALQLVTGVPSDAEALLQSIPTRVPMAERYRPKMLVVPLLQRPEEVRRAGGECVCSVCGKEYQQHQQIAYTDDPAADRGLCLILIQTCDGHLWKL